MVIFLFNYIAGSCNVGWICHYLNYGQRAYYLKALKSSYYVIELWDNKTFVRENVFLLILQLFFLSFAFLLFIYSSFGPVISQAKSAFLNKIVEGVPFEKMADWKCEKIHVFKLQVRGCIFKKHDFKGRIMILKAKPLF